MVPDQKSTERINEKIHPNNPYTDAKTIKDNLLQLRAAQNWTEILCLEGPARRGYHSSFLHNGRLYVHAGTDIQEGAHSDLWMLDLDYFKQAKSSLID